MALDTNLPMQGQQIDTASPLMNLVEMTRQSRIDNAQLATSGIDLQNKKNMLAMQTLTAAAAGGQQSYDTAKANLSQNGIDVSGWAPDYQTGQKQAQALQTALIPPATMLNSSIQLDRNNINRNENAGISPPAAPTLINSAPQIQQPAATDQQPAPQVQGSQTGPTVSQILAQPLQPTGSAGTTPPALSVQPQQPLQGAMQSGEDLQSFYQNAHPEDQKTAQNIVSGAAQLQSIQNDPEAVTKFLNDGNNIHDQHNIDMRKLWMSDNSPNKQQFWQANAVDLKAGQAMGIAPAATKDPLALPEFIPPKKNPNVSASQNNKDYANALEAHKAEIERITSSTQYKAAVAQAEASGKEAGALPEKAAASTELFGRIDQNLNAMLEVNSKVPQQGAILSAGAQADLSQRGLTGDNQEAANAYNAFTKVNKAQVLNGIQDLVQSGSIRNSRALITLVDNVNAIDVNASPASRAQQIEAVRAELKNLMISSQNINADLNGGQKQAYQSIPMEAPAAGSQIPTFSDPSDSAFKALPAGAKFIDKETGKTMVKH